MTTDEISASVLVALAKELNRQICDLNARVTVLRAELLATARESRARERARKDRRESVGSDDGATTSAPPTIWCFGHPPDEADRDDGCHTPALSHDARE